MLYSASLLSGVGCGYTAAVQKSFEILLQLRFVLRWIVKMGGAGEMDCTPRGSGRNIPGSPWRDQLVPIGNIGPYRHGHLRHLGANDPDLPEQSPVVGQPPEIFPQAGGGGNAASPAGRYRYRILRRHPIEGDPQPIAYHARSDPSRHRRRQ